MFRKTAGLIAALLVAGMGCLLYFSGLPLAGMPLFLGGMALVAWQGVRLFQSRRDPYDLNRLWESEPEPGDEPDEDWHGDKDTVYCHNCGHAVPEPFARCPDCGLTIR
ncbi:MAG: hypothetical protein H7Z41_10060 [Cytophagales bacterium]|nr:hypothetical protein [Armatimonadota bacterium]